MSERRSQQRVVCQDMAFLAGFTFLGGGVSGGLGFSPGPGVLSPGSRYLRCVVNWSWHVHIWSSDPWVNAGFNISMGSEVSGLGCCDFGSVLYGIGHGAGSNWKVVGDDAESTRVGRVTDSHFLAFGVDVSPAADLVAESVAVVDGSLSGVSITEAGLTEFILRVVLVGGQSGRVASVVRVTGSIGCWQSWSSDCWSGPVVVVVVVVRPLGLSSYGQKQDCYLAPNT